MTDEVKNPNNDESYEEWLDSALSTYSAAEPMAGLEERVLNRIRAEPERRRFALVNWALAIPTLASLMLASLWMAAVVVRTTPEKLEIAPARIAFAPPLAIPVTKAPARPHRRAPSGRPLPAPMTSQERDLIVLATRQPSLAIQALTDLQKKSEEPIEIEEIQIEPLQSDGGR